MPQTIYLVRHTTPAVAKGICYGQSDLDVTSAFPEESAVIRECLLKEGIPAAPEAGNTTIYSSPLQRCKKLANHLFPQETIHEAEELKEIHCGQWEMNSWDDIPRQETDPWMKDFVNTRIPGGESYLDLYGRVVTWFKEVLEDGPEQGREIRDDEKQGPKTKGPKTILLFSHGGVIRSILSFITGTPLIDSFKAFSLHYGCTIRLTRIAEEVGLRRDESGFLTADEPGFRGNDPGFRYEILSNTQPAEKEQHKPGTDSTFAKSDPL